MEKKVKNKRKSENVLRKNICLNIKSKKKQQLNILCNVFIYIFSDRA